MSYVKIVLCALGALFIGEFVLAWPLFNGSKATGLAAVVGLLVESLVSPRFWVISALLFGLFFAASRANTILRVLFFWIPTVTVSTLGFAFVGLCGFLLIRFGH